jgi:hypothetical protein
MFKRGNITIRAQAPDDAVWGHVFFDRDLEDGVTQVQHGVIYPRRVSPDELTVRAHGTGEPASASLEAWSRTAEALWERRRETPDKYAIYVVAHARSVGLPFEGDMDAVVRVSEESRASLWSPPSPIPADQRSLEQWLPEKWKILIGQREVGVLHVWEPAQPLVGTSEKGPTELPTHPTTDTESERLGITNELWYIFEDVVLGANDELRFTADSDGVLHDATQILSGSSQGEHPNGRCILVACSYYGAPQPWASQTSMASRK